jgi:FkbM family methyltransferase
MKLKGWLLVKIRQFIDRLLGAHLDEVGIVFQVIGGRPGTMMDVGAHYGSSLAPFLARGWNVYAFEPDPTNRAVLSANYPAATIDPRAVSEVDGAKVSLYTSDVSTGISALSPFHPTHSPTASVETVRLDSFVQAHGISRVDFLKTDVEGHDLAALRTFPWHSHHPHAVVCEFEDRKTVPLGHGAHHIAEFLMDKGYAVVVSEWEPIVEYGQNHHWRRFMPFPAEIPADSWGNLIAVEPHLLNRLNGATRWAVRKERLRRRVDGFLSSA